MASDDANLVLWGLPTVDDCCTQFNMTKYSMGVSVLRSCEFLMHEEEAPSPDFVPGLCSSVLTSCPVDGDVGGL